MEDNVLAVNIDDGGHIEVYWQDAASISVDAALLYIQSGQKEIEEYVDGVAKPEIENFSKTAVNTDLAAAMAVIHTTVDTAVEETKTAAESAALSAQEAENVLNDLGAVADCDLSNLTTVGQSKFDVKANAADVYTKEETDAKISSVYRYCGSVDTYESLPLSAVIGDVYNVDDTGANYAWTGSVWDKLSETVDLTPYLTKSSAAETYATLSSLSTAAFSGNYADLNGKPENVSEFVNDAGYLQAEEEPLYNAEKAQYALKSEFVVVSELPENPDANTFYFIPEA